MYSDWEDVTSSGRAFYFQVGPATGKAQLPTVDRLTGMAPEDDWCLPVSTVCREVGTSGPSLPDKAVHFREEL